MGNLFHQSNILVIFHVSFHWQQLNGGGGGGGEQKKLSEVFEDKTKLYVEDKFHATS